MYALSQFDRNYLGISRLEETKFIYQTNNVTRNFISAEKVDRTRESFATVYYNLYYVYSL